MLKDIKNIVKVKKAAALSDLLLGVLPADDVKYIVDFSFVFEPED